MTTTDKLVMSVPEYGKSRFGLSQNASYNAAASGDIPAVRIGKRLFVNVRVADEKFGFAPAAAVTDQPADVRALHAA